MIGVILLPGSLVIAAFKLISERFRDRLSVTPAGFGDNASISLPHFFEGIKNVTADRTKVI
ncbi:Uncharacterised protein [Klebsiella variicola]|nr:Uncharacterised protein [Klebsiella variicola]